MVGGVPDGVSGVEHALLVDLCTSLADWASSAFDVNVSDEKPAPIDCAAFITQPLQYCSKVICTVLVVPE